MVIDDRLDILGSLWSIWAGHGRAMSDEQWRRPTRLGDWDVRSLYAHAAWWPRALAALAGLVRDAEPTHATAAGLLRDFNAPEGIATRMRGKVAADARGYAGTYGTAQLTEQFADTGPRAIDAARRLGPAVVDYFGQGVLRLEEALSIGILEATVHLLDLRDALGEPADMPAEALTHTAQVLAQMTPPVEFIEMATGRRTADLFPVLT